LACRAHIFRIAANAEELAVGPAYVAELGRHEHPIAFALDRAPDQFLVPADAVHVGRVEEGHAALDRVVDGRDRFRFAAAGVEFAHADAAEADGRAFPA